MLGQLKAAIEAKKREQASHAQPSQPKPNLPDAKVVRTEDDAEAERIRKQLELKAKRYAALIRGESDTIPSGALVDFEGKLNKKLKSEGQDEDESDDKSRSMATIAFPDGVERITNAERRVKNAVDDILETVRDPSN